MQPSSRLLRISAAITAAVMLSAPVATFAATPQQIIQNSLLTLNDRLPLNQITTMDVHVSERQLTGDRSTANVEFKTSLAVRLLAKAGDHQDNEGRLVFDGFRVTGSFPSLGLPITSLDEPIAIQWRYVDKKLYVRLERIPNAIVDYLKGQGTDLAPYVGRWIAIDGELGGELARFSTQSALGSTLGGSDVSSTEREFRARPIFLVTRVEKRETREDGHQIVRVRMRINPALVNALHRAALRGVHRDLPYWREEVKGINAQFAEIRRFIARLQFVGVVDTSIERLERVEVGGVFQQPTNTSEWNARLKRYLSRVTAITTYRFTAGTSYLRDPGTPVMTPTDTLSLQTIIDEHQPTSTVQGTEVTQITDTDGDGLSDSDETNLYGTDPLRQDSDGDGYDDRMEVSNGYNPRGTGMCAVPTCVI